MLQTKKGRASIALTGAGKSSHSSGISCSLVGLYNVLSGVDYVAVDGDRFVDRMGPLSDERLRQYFDALGLLPGDGCYAEVNLDFLGANAMVMTAFRVLVILSVGFGSIVALTAVWDFADVCSGAMALMNIVVIVLLGKWAFSALQDWEQQRKEGRDPTYSVDAALLADAPARVRDDFQNESAWPLPEESGRIPSR